ncbi:AraC family transcriptional regulator [Idiomarina sp. HP20-50]|uniref:helix-turn-helix domain-containing protein n=1 Tax=Idiomarina sp. HP20-50 TaxID=3070813 RepID=UPI00294B6769|nr:AraC family transcriptional regulator [Idiomarina sp. HP20-50]MDV6314909.1 AraC family transcriptional regulator [Idiomarina sp. HP20-50]
MLLIDALIRFSAIGFLLLMTVAVIRDLPRSTRCYLMIATNLCLASFLLGSMPSEFALPSLWQIPFRLLDTLLLPVTWVFVLTLFHRNLRFGVLHLGIFIAVSGSILVERFVWLSWLDELPQWWSVVVNTLALGLVTHMMLVTLLGRNDDLIETRRKYRLYFLFIITASMLLAILVGSVWLRSSQPTIYALSVWLPIFSMALWVLKGDRSALTFYRDTARKNPLSVADEQILFKLNELMKKDRIYLNETLTTRALAQKLGVAEHKLRTLINTQTGFNNFSHYINSFRLKDVINCFSCRDNDHLPILTIALNHGFNSLPPFNRAFKKETGITPSQFRKNQQDFRN